MVILDHAFYSIDVSNRQGPFIACLMNRFFCRCVFWDSQLKKYSDRGVVTVNATMDWVHCAATHLTQFAAIQVGLPRGQCQQNGAKTFLTLDADENLLANCFRREYSFSYCHW
jgi:hypothetical protein